MVTDGPPNLDFQCEVGKYLAAGPDILRPGHVVDIFREIWFNIETLASAHQIVQSFGRKYFIKHFKVDPLEQL